MTDSNAGRPGPLPDFDAAYNSGQPPWDTGRPQPAFEALARAGALRGRVLDLGCGTGEHALLAAGLGLEAVGLDLSPKAIELAQRKARERGLAARFVVGDALKLAELGETFDTALDCGLFHLLADADRPALEAGLRAALRPGGRYFLLGFSDRMPVGFGPRRLSQAELRATFAEGWRVDAIEPSAIETTMGVAPPSWLASFTRL